MALDIAAQTGGVIVNADAMQVYSVLNVLTARPDAASLEAARHELYGHIHPSTAYSVASWLADVESLAAEGLFAERPAIFVGGTGLYFSALTRGLSKMPAIPASLRKRLRSQLLAEGPAALHALLAEWDPQAAARLGMFDGQRIVRALEVLEASGRSILDWQAQRSVPLVDIASARLLILDPDRDILAQHIDKRFDRMMDDGGLDEARRLLELGLDPSFPAMKAIGVRELGGILAGDWSPDDGIRRAKAATRQYAKRQMTWLRNQFGADWQRIRS